MSSEEWLKKAKNLANEYAHCYSFVGDNTMPMAQEALFKHLELMQTAIEYCALIAQCNRDRVDYPDFYKKLWQWQDDNGSWIEFAGYEFHDKHEYRQHPHRARIVEFNQCGDDDKLRWQEQGGGWNGWMSCDEEPLWREDCEYRLRPRTCRITINGTVLEYPEPVRKSLKFGDGYWYVYPDRVEHHTWYNGSDVCKRALKAGGIHLTEQAAKQHLNVLQAVNAQVAE